MPGSLPVINKEAVTQAIKLGLSCQASFNNYCEFARKNYFYPDLPKGYQISQYKNPIISEGQIEIHPKNEEKQIIRIQRAHLEEDAGKSNHDTQMGKSYIDLNRAGQPLLEIVTHPDIHSIESTISYLKTLHTLVRYLDICDGNMQEGSFRCDVNISLRKNLYFGTRVGQNLNSFNSQKKPWN